VGSVADYSAPFLVWPGELAPARQKEREKTMKYVKMMCLAAAAVALVALLGVGAASATVLCKVEPTTGGVTTGTVCPAGQAYPAGTEIHLKLTTAAKMTVGFFTYECLESTIKGETGNEGSATETVNVPLSAMTYGKCNCSTVALKRGSLEIHWIPDTYNGTVTVSGQEVTYTCNTIFGTMHCLITPTVHDIGVIKGSTEPTQVTENRSLDPTSALCNEKPEWDGLYEVASPRPLWIAGHT